MRFYNRHSSPSAEGESTSSLFSEFWLPYQSRVRHGTGFARMTYSIFSQALGQATTIEESRRLCFFRPRMV